MTLRGAPVPMVLMSVRPRFAAALLDGSKTVEIRRRRVRIAAGTICLLYATSPEKSLVGAVTVAATSTCDPAALWQEWGARTELRREEFDDYLAGCTEASAILIASAGAFTEPIPLAELRRRHTSFLAPQSYRFLAREECGSLLNGQAKELSACTARGCPTSAHPGTRPGCAELAAGRGFASAGEFGSCSDADRARRSTTASI